VTAALAASYAYCRQVTRTQARNFYYSFVLLSRERRDALCAVYAFMRHCDDLSDEPGANRQSLDQWRALLDQTLEHASFGHPGLPALYDTVSRYRIPARYFHDMIDGVTADLKPRRFESFAQLYRYCYQVAATAGLSTIHIMGFESPDAPALAEKCGIAFQLTNILRDIREDAERGRIYLPAEDLTRFGVTEQHMRAGLRTSEFMEMMAFETARARAYYAESRPLLEMVERRNRASLAALVSIYSRLLDRIEDSRYDVFSRRISLPAWEKSLLVLRSLARYSYG
jgi:phytoene synthase